MSEIDWSKADGAEYFAHEDSYYSDAYYKKGEDGWLVATERNDWDWVSVGRVDIDRELIERPTPTTWRGPEDGLPPVGTVCECSYFGSEQGLVEVKYSGDFMVLWNINGNHEQCAPANEYSFRVPKPRPEQIAAEELKAAIDEMSEVTQGAHDWLQAFQKLHLAGYRKKPSA